jgi:hypothetical protein
VKIRVNQWLISLSLSLTHKINTVSVAVEGIEVFDKIGDNNGK